jgi:sugar O-acyltransferase (sialic acid O-acetyltransferase NeuD family)
MSNKLILVGGGGHCKACIEVIEASDKFIITGVIDRQCTPGANFMGYAMLGDDEIIPKCAKDPQNNFLISVGQIHSPDTRISLSKRIKQAGGKMAIVISPFAIVSKNSDLASGTIVMHQSIVNSNCRIGEHGILNNRSLVEHDCIIGDFCHVSTGAIINGNCTIGDRVFVGSSAVLINGITVTSDVIIGAGAVVHQSIKEPGVYVGNPALKVSKKDA